MRAILFFLLLVIASPILSATIDCYSNGKSIYHQIATKIYSTPEHQLIIVRNKNATDLVDADCVIRYKFNRK